LALFLFYFIHQFQSPTSSLSPQNTNLTFADISPSIETFADVENLLRTEENECLSHTQNPETDGWGRPKIDVEPTDSYANGNGEEKNGLHSPETEENSPSPIRSTGRRVTFSNEVSACPPPGGPILEFNSMGYFLKFEFINI
jgi:hypothetical protein